MEHVLLYHEIINAMQFIMLIRTKEWWDGK